METSIAIITARGGSKRIPKKNIKKFCGKPIISYSIFAALESRIFDEVMVSTDDEEIAEIAIDCGAKVPFMRSKKNSDDFATTADVLLEVLDEYKKSGRVFDFLCCIYPTAPFVTPLKLQNAFKILIESEADSIVPIVKYSFPPQRSFFLESNNIKISNPEDFFKRSQDLKPLYHDCGQYYFAKVEGFLKEKTLIMKDTRAIITEEIEVQDIDNEEDWKLAEAKFRLLKGIENGNEKEL